ncbi:MAG: cell division protein FtsQ/DivIB [Paraglaciecola sp.]|uniref:cell division protein FtsQ/DivIB n=1 Tax=Paraglaciecola sp. TaxID=1920173 RepID=UPI0032990E55
MSEQPLLEKSSKGSQFYAGLVFFVTLIILLVIGVIELVAWLEDEQQAPVQNIVVSGNRTFIDDVEVEALIKRTQSGSFFELNVDETHKTVESMPWVYRASVRKRWPSGLEVFVVEQIPSAIWNDDMLLNKNGDVFNAQISGLAKLKQLRLPSLFGPGGSEQTALQGYRNMQSLLDSTNLHIVEMFLSERFAWNIQLSNGIRLNLGRIEFIDRLQRFVDLYPLISKQDKQVDYVDLRYDTGLAVGWKTAENQM